ncbi:MAG: ribosome maturation factor RimM [Clostridia bacterium]
MLVIGKIVNTHGIKGEVKVYPYTDDIDNLCNLKKIKLDNNLEYIVNKASFHKNMCIFKLEGIDKIEDTTKLMNKDILVDKTDITEEDTYYIEDLIGLDVYLKDKLLGKIVNVFSTGSNDVYEIKGDKTIYLPAIKDVVEFIDINSNKMIVKKLEGLDYD